MFTATWQRGRVHFKRNALAFANKGQRQMVLALINTALAQETTEGRTSKGASSPISFARSCQSSRRCWTMRRTTCWRLWTFRSHIGSRSRPRIRSSGSNAEIKRRPTSSASFPNDAAIVRLVGALLLEQNDEWQLQRRYPSLDIG